MAVQAQYPSNVLHLNRNGQEGHAYSIQPQPGGFLDQNSMIFNNGAGDTNSTPINPMFSLQQSQPPQFHNQQPNVVSTGLHLSFGYQHQQLQHNHSHSQQQQQQQTQNTSNSSPLLSLLTEDFASQIKQQRDEIDQFLQAQGEQLRRALAEKRQRHYRALLSAAEESITRRLKEKEAEVEKATRRHAELQARAAQLGMEVQVWQAKARAQEATAASLQAQVQQVMMSGMAHDRRAGEDGLPCAMGVEGQAEDAESVYIDPERAVVSGPSCKACRKRFASVVLLPCRHLCVCSDCDQMAQACPLCFSLKNSSLEVFLS